MCYTSISRELELGTVRYKLGGTRFEPVPRCLTFRFRVVTGGFVLLLPLISHINYNLGVPSQ